MNKLYVWQSNFCILAIRLVSTIAVVFIFSKA